jgi:hypothetical protein
MRVIKSLWIIEEGKRHPTLTRKMTMSELWFSSKSHWSAISEEENIK